MADLTDWDDAAEKRAGPLEWFLKLMALAYGAFVVMVVSAFTGGDELADLGRDPFGLIALGTIVLHTVTGILWVRWFRVVAKRTEHTGHARFRGQWWFWAWVFPGASLVLPKMMINDAWRAGARPGEWDPMPRVINWWWASWVTVGGIVYVTDQLDSLPDLVAFLVFAVMLPSMPVSAVLAIGVVRRLTERVRHVYDTPTYADASLDGSAR